MKKTLCIISSVLFVCLIAGCSNSADTGSVVTEQMKDGVYTSIASGKSGKFEVTTVISQGKITEILIGKNKETPEKGGLAIEQLPEKIVEEQSLDVDTVSNATNTSKAILNAVSESLQLAAK